MNFKDSAIVITMVRSPEELSRLGLLIISIRTWGGALARLRIAFFNVNPAQISRKELEDDITESIMMEIPDNLRGYYYGDKVYACARTAKRLASQPSTPRGIIMVIKSMLVPELRNFSLR